MNCSVRPVHIEALSTALLGPTRVSRPLPRPIFISNLPGESHSMDVDLAREAGRSFAAMFEEKEEDDEKDSLDGFDGTIVQALTEGTPLHRSLNVNRRKKLDLPKIFAEVERSAKVHERIYQDPFYLHVLAAMKDATIVVRDECEFAEIERDDPGHFIYFPGPGIKRRTFEDRDAFLGAIMDDLTPEHMKKIRVWTLRSLARIGRHGDPSRLTREDLVTHLRGKVDTARNVAAQSSGSLVASNSWKMPV